MSQRSIILVFGALLLMIAFQNCGKAPQDVQFSQQASKQSDVVEDHGHPYDGKVFFVIGDLCPDGTKIQARMVLKDPSHADLVRRQCQEIAPIALTSADFNLDSSNPDQLTYQNQVFSVQLIGTKIDLAKVSPETGYLYWTPYGYDFGTSIWDTDTAPTASTLQIFEDGKLMGPAHSMHQDIRTLGMGRYSHWLSHLYFSASDNSNPLTNGRTYTYIVK